jgi:hypothetical protein
VNGAPARIERAGGRALTARSPHDADVEHGGEERQGVVPVERWSRGHPSAQLVRPGPRDVPKVPVDKQTAARQVMEAHGYPQSRFGPAGSARLDALRADLMAAGVYDEPT